MDVYFKYVRNVSRETLKKGGFTKMANGADIKSKRVNIRMSEGIFDYFDKLSNEMGVSRSFVMVMALKNYMDTQQSLEFASGLPAMMQQMELLSKQQEGKKNKS